VNGDTDSSGLLAQSASGDIDAYRQLFDEHSAGLYSFVYYLTFSREESEGITQEAFIKVYEALQGRDTATFNFQAYLYKTARNLSLNAIARRKREGLTLAEAMDVADPGLASDPERAAFLSEQRSKVLAAAEELTEDQQAALLMRELEGFRYDTISEVLDSNPNAVGAMLSRARLKFREVLRMSYAQTEAIGDRCTALTPLLSKYIDGEASAQESLMVESHLADCPICRGNLESMKEASVTYRSLIPVLPLAALKVWGASQAAIMTGTAAGAAQGAGAAAGSAVAAAATVGAAATAATATSKGWSRTMIVAAVVIGMHILSGAGIGTYMILKSTIWAKKKVPNFSGLTSGEAKKTAEASGLITREIYPETPYRHDVVVALKQEPAVDILVDSGTAVRLTFQDKGMDDARAQAENRIGSANNALAEVHGMGLDTSDLDPTLRQAQAKHDQAKTLEDYVGTTNSAAYYSDVVIQGCTAKKAAEAARQQAAAQQAAAAAAAAAAAPKQRTVIARCPVCGASDPSVWLMTRGGYHCFRCGYIWGDPNAT
jgi:RNA polymerase sigma-70 factor (ECF subfamily)